MHAVMLSAAARQPRAPPPQPSPPPPPQSDLVGSPQDSKHSHSRPFPRSRHDNATIVFELGDSQSRVIVFGQCGAQHRQTTDWGRGLFLYQQPCRSCEKRGKPTVRQPIDATAVCTTDAGDKLGFLMVYGAQARGPYLHNISTNLADPAVDSTERYCKGIAAFSAAQGVPDAVVLATLNWDALLYIEGVVPPIDPLAFEKPEHTNFTAQQLGIPSTRPADPGGLALYESEIRARLKEIDACKHPATAVYLQTTQTSRMDAGQYNDVLRRLAREPGLGISGMLDVDRMLHDGELDPPGKEGCEPCRYDNPVVKLHPSPAHSAAFARYVIDTVRGRQRIG